MSLLRRVLGEWPLALAAAALLSLLFLPRFARSESLNADREAGELAALRRVVETGVADSEDRVRAFLIRHPAGPHTAEAQYLAGLAVLVHARGGVFPGVPVLNRAWVSLSAALRGGHDAAAATAAQLELARLLVERGRLAEGTERLAELRRRQPDPDLALELARALARRAKDEGGRRQALLDEAAALISDFVREAPAERRLQGFLAQARIQWDLGRFEEMLPPLVRELADAKRPSDRGLLQLERGRALARLGRNAEALAALDEAERLATDPSTNAIAVLFQAELFARAGNAEAAELCRRVMGGGTGFVPLAQVVLGVHELEFRPEAAPATLAAGLAGLRRPRLLDEAGFDLGWLHASLCRAWDAEADPARLEAFAALAVELQRLYPDRAVYFVDEARLRRRAGRPDLAADRLLAAAAIQSGPARDASLREAATTCLAGGLPARAAELFRRWYEANPDANLKGLYERGEALKTASRFTEALAALDEFLLRCAGRAPEAAAAVLARGAILEDLGRREDALSEYERILRARDLPADPARPEWAAALLRKGALLLDLDRPREARPPLEEYVERYGRTGGGGTARAAELLVRAASRESRWKEALAALERFSESASRLEGDARAPFEERLGELRFLEGDFRYQLGDFDGAARAYGEGYQRRIEDDARLWGLVGRGRSLARLGRMEEARRDHANARALFEERAKSFEVSLGGRGREFWSASIELLGRELR